MTSLNADTRNKRRWARVRLELCTKESDFLVALSSQLTDSLLNADGSKVALKKMIVKELQQTEGIDFSAIREIRILRELKSDYLVNVLPNRPHLFLITSSLMRLFIENQPTAIFIWCSNSCRLTWRHWSKTKVFRSVLVTSSTTFIKFWKGAITFLLFTGQFQIGISEGELDNASWSQAWQSSPFLEGRAQDWWFWFGKKFWEGCLAHTYCRYEVKNNQRLSVLPYLF